MRFPQRFFVSSGMVVAFFLPLAHPGQGQSDRTVPSVPKARVEDENDKVRKRSSDVTVAFLEDWYTDASYGVGVRANYRRQVRRAFSCTKGVWSACPMIPTDKDENIDHERHRRYALKAGSVIGEVDSVPYAGVESWSNQLNTEKIIESSLSEPPAARDPQSKFTCYSAVPLSEPVILSSLPHSTLFDSWTKTDRLPDIDSALKLLENDKIRSAFLTKRR